ncbi:MAG: VanZ family protein [Candidatus Eisenbacteria bacterium]|nr:VanZ family protein [Candidatus Eisenbacteria bacterium]
MLFWLPVLVYVTVIIAMSSQSRLQPPLHFVNADKLFHALEYFGLGVLVARAIRGGMRVSRPLFAAMMALAFGILVGAGDEFYQRFVPGRDASVLDLLADTIGTAVAQFAYVWFVEEKG